MTGFESYTTATLLKVRDNLWQGLGRVGEQFIAGTANVSAHEKACTPEQFGATLTLPLFLNVNTVLVSRGESDWTGRLS